MKRYSLRSRRSEGDQKPKRQKLETINGPSAEQNASSTRLTDVNDDCLERIFLYLNLDDLLNIVHTNKQLKNAADLAFSRKYDGTKSKIFVDSFHFSIELNGNPVRLISLHNPYRLLRSFGHLLSNLVVHTQKVVSYVNEYCFESATEISFYKMSKADFNGLQKLFANVEVLSLISCILGSKVMQLNSRFPKIRMLKLIRLEAQPKCIKVHFPYLEQLEIKGALPTARINDTLSVLQLNPQLRRLILDTDYTTTFLRTASMHLPSLQHLDIHCVRKDFTDFDNEFANFAQLKVFKVDYEGGMSIKPPIKSSCLQEFSWTFLGTHVSSSISTAFVEFLKENPSIIKLNLICWYPGIRKLNDDTLTKKKKIKIL